MSNQISFTKIDHRVRKLYGLSMNEYAVIDLVYHLSSNPASSYPGWCYAAKETMGDMLGLTKMTVHTILNKAEEKGLVTRHEVTRHIRTTEKWYNNAYFMSIDEGKESLPLVKEIHPEGYRNFTPKGKESLHNINIDMNKDINKNGKPVFLNNENELTSDNIQPSSLNNLGSVLTSKQRELANKKADKIVDKHITTEKQLRGLEVIKRLDLPDSFKGRVIRACEGRQLHQIEEAVKSTLKMDRASTTLVTDDQKAKYFFKVVQSVR